MTSPLGRRIEPAVSTIGRLKRRPDFLAAAGGRRFHTEHMSAQGRLRDAAGTAMSGDEAAVEGLRVGFTITKRVGHATERNRIRRRLRDAVLRASADLPQAAADIVLVARRPALHAPFETLVADLRRSVGAVIKPGGGKRPDSGQAPRGGGRSGKRSGKGSGANNAPAAKAGPDAASPGAGSPAGRAASPSSHHPAAAAAQGEASLPHRASGDGRGPFPPSNTRDGSLDG